MKTLSILGTGWLGLEVAKSLQNEFKVKVSSRTIEKIPFYENLNLETYLLNETNKSNLTKLLDCNFLFINFPPSKFENYLNFLAEIYSNEMISKIEKIIFISSSSIYPKDDGIYTEDTKINTPTSKIVFDAEMLINQKTDIIFRCSGLIGGSRIAGRWSAGKEIKDSDSKINYIHREDIINATRFGIKQNISGIFNLCAPLHPTKKEVYLKNSLKYDFETPIFLNTILKDRVIDGSKITKLGFKYQFENPLYF